MVEVIEEDAVIQGVTEKECYTEKQIGEVANQAECFTEENKRKLLQTLMGFRNIFSNQPGRINCYEHEIILRDYSPFFVKAYPIPLVYKNEVARQIK